MESTSGLPTIEYAIISNIDLDNVFRIPCDPHPQYPPNPVSNILSPYLKRNGRTQVVKGWVNNTEHKARVEMLDAIEKDPRLIDPSLRDIVEKIRYDYYFQVGQIVNVIARDFHFPMNIYSFDLQVRHVNDPQHLTTFGESYHLDKWGVWCPWYKPPPRGADMSRFNPEFHPRYVICVYIQNFYPSSAMLGVKSISSATEQFMGDVQYGNENAWPIKIAIIDQQQYMHAPASVDGGNLFAHYRGDKWRVLLRIHVPDIGQTWSGGRAPGNATKDPTSEASKNPTSEASKDPTSEIEWLV